MVKPLAIDEIRAARERLGSLVITTPVHRLQAVEVEHLLGSATEIHLKLELFQRTGTFKARAALLNVLALDAEQRARGITAVSAGNHAIATACAARLAGTTAKVVMTRGANALRVDLCRREGADIVFADTMHEAFEIVERIAASEGRRLIHPFEGRATAVGTATVGLELCEQVPGLEMVIVPVGGGGLAAGVASAVRLLAPACEVFGVEPEGADTLSRSLAAGRPERIERVATIADSLGAPYALPVSFELCRRNLAGVVRVSDEQIVDAMRLLLRTAKLAVEPAAAAAAAALLGPLRERARGRRLGLIVCGSNIDEATFAGLIVRNRTGDRG